MEFFIITFWITLFLIAILKFNNSKHTASNPSPQDHTLLNQHAPDIINQHQKLLEKRVIPTYEPKRLMTYSEVIFFRKLEQYFSRDYYIFTQIGLSHILGVSRVYDRYSSSYQTLLNKINRKSVDFVIFSRVDFRPLIAIELDDYTHYQYKRIKRDNFVNSCMNVINLPILHFRSRYLGTNDINTIEQAIEKRLIP